MIRRCTISRSVTPGSACGPRTVDSSPRRDWLGCAIAPATWRCSLRSFADRQPSCSARMSRAGRLILRNSLAREINLLARQGKFSPTALCKCEPYAEATMWWDGATSTAYAPLSFFDIAHSSSMDWHHRARAMDDEI